MARSTPASSAASRSSPNTTGHPTVSSQPQLDLDQVARELTGLLPDWAERGHRSRAVSLAASGNEAPVIIWCGGWADVGLLQEPASFPALRTFATLQPVSRWLNPIAAQLVITHDRTRKEALIDLGGCVAVDDLFHLAPVDFEVSGYGSLAATFGVPISDRVVQRRCRWFRWWFGASRR